MAKTMLLTDAQTITIRRMLEDGWLVTVQKRDGAVLLTKDGERCRVSANGRAVVSLPPVSVDPVPPSVRRAFNNRHED